MAVRITDQLLKRSNPDPNRKPIWDSVVTGFHFRPHTREKGQGQFYVKYRAGGKQRRTKIGAYPGTKLAVARKKAADIMLAVGAGKDPAPAKPHQNTPERRQDGTVAAIIDLFVERYCKRNQKTWRETERMLNQLVVPTLGGHNIGEITRRDILDLLDAAVENNGPTTANRLHAYLSKMFNWAVIQDYLDLSPMVRGMKPAREQSRDRTLTDDEMRKIWQATRNLGIPFGPFYRFLILTGQRLRECAGIRWQELHGLDSDRPVWIIPRDRYKTNIEQRLPLSRAAVDALLEMRPVVPEDYRHVFIGRNDDNPINGYGRVKGRLDKASGVADWKNHDLRRTMRTWMGLDRDIGVAIAELCIGHKRQGIEAVYNVAVPEDHMREAFEKWAGHLTAFDEAPAKVVSIR